MRKVIQLTAVGEDLFALCNDGSIWWDRPGHGWTVQKGIPQHIINSTDEILEKSEKDKEVRVKSFEDFNEQNLKL